MTNATPVSYETKSMRIIPQDRNGRKMLEKMMNEGWELVTKDDSLILRGGIYTFRRPRQPTRKELKAIEKAQKKAARG